MRRAAIVAAALAACLVGGPVVAVAVQVQGSVPATGQRAVEGTRLTFTDDQGAQTSSTVQKDGSFTASLDPGKRYAVTAEGAFTWKDALPGLFSYYRPYTVPATGAPGPVDVDLMDLRAPDLWSPPFGGIVFGPVERSGRSGNGTIVEKIRYDQVQRTGVTFKVPTEAAGMHDLNNNVTVAETWSLVGLNGMIGLPGFYNSRDGRLTHSIGATVGGATYDLKISSRRDQHREAQQLGGDGVALGLDYTLTYTQVPSRDFWSRFGGRVNLAFQTLQIWNLGGFPHDRDGLSGFNAAFVKDDGSADIRQYEVKADLLVRLCGPGENPEAPQLYGFVGIGARFSDSQIVIKNDHVIPGLNEVTRKDSLKVTSTDVLFRAGADTVFGKIPLLGWAIGGRAEVEVGQKGSYNTMLKLLVTPSVSGRE